MAAQGAVEGVAVRVGQPRKDEAGQAYVGGLGGFAGLILKSSHGVGILLDRRFSDLLGRLEQPGVDDLEPRVAQGPGDDLDAPIKRVASEDVPVPFNHYLEIAMQPSVDKVVTAVKEICYR